MRLRAGVRHCSGLEVELGLFVCREFESLPRTIDARVRRFSHDFGGVARPERFELPIPWFVGPIKISGYFVTQ